MIGCACKITNPHSWQAPTPIAAATLAIVSLAAVPASHAQVFATGQDQFSATQDFAAPAEARVTTTG